MRMGRITQAHFVLLAALLLAVTGCKKVPDLTGMTEQEARERLEGKKLKAGQITTAKKGETAGTVVDQDPKPGAKIPDDMTVALVLEAGGETKPKPVGDTGESSIAAVPDLTGKTQADAETALTNAGLGRGSLDVVVDNHPEGTVFFQDPPANLQVASGTLVNIKVASSGMVAVPSVVGDTEPVARQKLVSAELAVGEVTPVIAAGAVGAVVEQNPDPGVRVAKGQPVRLKIRQASAFVPNVVGQSRKDALIALFQRDLAPVISWSVNPNLPPAQEDIVNSQSIAPNLEVAKETRVGLIVLTRTKRVRIPVLVERTGRTKALTGLAVREFTRP